MLRIHRFTAPLAAVLALSACDGAKENSAAKAADAPKAAKAEAKPEAKPEANPEVEPKKAEAPAKPRAEFAAMPQDAIALKLEMLGSQFKAPKGAKLGRNINGWQDLDAGDDFAMVIRETYDEPDAIKEELGEVKYVVDEPDTLVYEKEGGFGFVSIVEVKGPEELDGEADRRLECRAGSAMDWAVSKKPKHFPRETIDLMVATCRTIKLADF